MSQYPPYQPYPNQPYPPPPFPQQQQLPYPPPPGGGHQPIIHAPPTMHHPPFAPPFGGPPLPHPPVAHPHMITPPFHPAPPTQQVARPPPPHSMPLFSPPFGGIAPPPLPPSPHHHQQQQQQQQQHMMMMRPPFPQPLGPQMSSPFPHHTMGGIAPPPSPHSIAMNGISPSKPPMPLNIHSPIVHAHPPSPQQQQQQKQIGMSSENIPNMSHIDRKTTVYVANISPRLSDELLQQILRTCGHFDKWRRMKDDKTKMWKPFGFCEYSSVESAIVALQVLNGMKLEGSVLELKTDPKTQQFIQEYRQRKIELIADRMKKEASSSPSSDNEERYSKEYDRQMQLAVDQAMLSLDHLFSMHEHLRKENEMKQHISAELAVKNTMEKMAATGAPDEETNVNKAIISDSIRKFREIEKRKEEEKLAQLAREKRRREEREQYERRKREESSERYARRSPSSKAISPNGVRASPSLTPAKTPVAPTLSLKLKMNSKNEKETEKEQDEDEDVFGGGDEDDEEESIYKRKSALAALDEIDEDEKQNPMDQIPTDRDSLFNYPVDWEVFDKYAVYSSLKGYVDRQTIRLLGVEEQTMTQFILGKLRLHCKPQELISDLVDVLEQETEPLVIDLWKNLLLLIAENKIKSL